jgi:hypothetical protein
MTTPALTSHRSFTWRFTWSCAWPAGPAEIADRQPVGPPLQWSEAVSAIRQAVWRRDITEAMGTEALARFMAAPIERRVPRTLYRRTWQIASQLGWAKDIRRGIRCARAGARVSAVARDRRLERRLNDLVEVVSPTKPSKGGPERLAFCRVLNRIHAAAATTKQPGPS